ncbi:MAG: matrixin family metalloprotease [Myxococcota bacterium]
MWFAAVTATALAYDVKRTADGAPLRWELFPVPYGWAGGEPEVDAAEDELRAAFAAWSDVRGTPVGFERAPVGRAAPSESPDDANVVWITESWPYDPDLLALTSSWSDEDGTVVAFDVRVNGRVDWATDGDPDAFDFRAAMVHEVGHALGLEHSADDRASMYATAGHGETWRAVLSDDDEAGLRFLYPEVAPEPPADPSALPWSCATGPGAPGALVSLLVLALGARRPRRFPC